jgi:hypothetical protein
VDDPRPENEASNMRQPNIKIQLPNLFILPLLKKYSGSKKDGSCASATSGTGFHLSTRIFWHAQLKCLGIFFYMSLIGIASFL